LSLITAPLPKTSTVCVVSENGSRLALPSMVRAPFTVTGISTAAGCGLAPVPAVDCEESSGSFAIGAMAYLLAFVEFVDGLRENCFHATYPLKNGGAQGSGR
jgi:hypothetical protein